MHARKLGAAFVAVLAATTVASCGSGEEKDSPISWSPVTGDRFTANPGAWQTDGVPVPEAGVSMVGDPIPAQAVANAGLQQGTVTATSGDTTVYYPKAPEIPGLPVAPDQVTPPPPQLQRPTGTAPWRYTPFQIAAFRQICETGRWNDWAASTEVQTQTCWTVYGRQLGVRPWHPGQPKPWERPSWPTPWFERDFRPDVPVMWVYPPTWSKPKPQPLISVSIGLNLPRNPYARPNPQRRTEAYYPVWAVTPGRPVVAREQSRVVAPWIPGYATATSTTTYIAPPAYPGVTLAGIPSDGRVQLLTAIPGQRLPENPNTDAAVLIPTAAAIKGATLYSGSRADLAQVYGADADVRTATATTTSATSRAVSASTTSESTTSESTTSASTTSESTSRSTAPSADTTTTTAPATGGSGTRTSAPGTGTASSTAPESTTTEPTRTAPSATSRTPRPSATTTAPTTTTAAATTTTTPPATTTTTRPAPTTTTTAP